ncbi:FGGY-family carbohydrate kinase [soil metagenome]
MDLVVGIDVATADVRAVAADADGRIHGEGRAGLPQPQSPRPGWCEQDARAWWPAVATSLRRLSEGLGVASRSIVGVSVSATSGTVVAVDSDGEPVGDALMYSDQRAVDEADVAQAAGEARWADLGLRVQPSFGLPKWGWLCRHRDGGRTAARLAHPSDVVVGHLVGYLPPTDWSHALKSGYDPRLEQWAEEALGAVGVPLRLLPEVQAPTTLVGRLSAEAAEQTGLPPTCEVRLGMTDACTSQLAAGASSPGRFVSVLGTTLVLKGASRDVVTYPTGAFYSHRHPQGWWLPVGASSTGGAALSASFAGRDLVELDALALRHGPSRCIAYPLVGRGERFPFVAPDAEGFVVGDPVDEVDRYRATLEGVAFVERLGYEHLARLGAPAEPPISASGAGSGSRAWNQIRASVLGAPLIEEPGANTALGACILAAAGTLHGDLAAATEAMALSGEQVDPEAQERDALDDSYERFLAALADRGWLGLG